MSVDGEALEVNLLISRSAQSQRCLHSYKGRVYVHVSIRMSVFICISVCIYNDLKKKTNKKVVKVGSVKHYTRKVILPLFMSKKLHAQSFSLCPKTNIYLVS